jgi:hypothetical protein
VVADGFVVFLVRIRTAIWVDSLLHRVPKTTPSNLLQSEGKAAMLVPSGRTVTFSNYNAKFKRRIKEKQNQSDEELLTSPRIFMN